jgi:hypothetical protein
MLKDERTKMAFIVGHQVDEYYETMHKVRVMRAAIKAEKAKGPVGEQQRKDNEARQRAAQRKAEEVNTDLRRQIEECRENKRNMIAALRRRDEAEALDPAADLGIPIP